MVASNLSLAVDCVVFGTDLGSTSPLKVLLIRRGTPPFVGRHALPGGRVEIEGGPTGQGEGLEEAARRELEEETGVKLSFLEQLYTFGEPGRDPRGRVISVAYFGLVRAGDHEAAGSSDAIDAAWVSVDKAMKGHLAFDHDNILDTAVRRLRMKVRYEPLGFNLLPANFTLRQLQELYEAVLGRKFDKANFRKRILAMSILAETGVEESPDKPGPSAKLYRFDKRAYSKAVKNGFNFEI